MEFKVEKDQQCARVLGSKLNFRVTEYYDCIDCSSTEISEPQITKRFSSQEIHNINSGSMFQDSLVCFPTHSQTVEKTVTILTEATSKIWSHRPIKARKRCKKFRKCTSYLKRYTFGIQHLLGGTRRAATSSWSILGCFALVPNIK